MASVGVNVEVVTSSRATNSTLPVDELSATARSMTATGRATGASGGGGRACDRNRDGGTGGDAREKGRATRRGNEDKWKWKWMEVRQRAHAIEYIIYVPAMISLTRRIR